jgi:hypothetical protein
MLFKKSTFSTVPTKRPDVIAATLDQTSSSPQHQPVVTYFALHAPTAPADHDEQDRRQPRAAVAQRERRPDRHDGNGEEGPATHMDGSLARVMGRAHPCPGR